MEYNTVILENNTFTGFHNIGHSGGVFFSHATSLVDTNSVYADNSATGYGGVFAFSNQARAVITGSQFYLNSAPYAGVFHATKFASLHVHNSDIWGNTGSVLSGVLNIEGQASF